MKMEAEELLKLFKRLSFSNAYKIEVTGMMPHPKEYTQVEYQEYGSINSEYLYDIVDFFEEVNVYNKKIKITVYEIKNGELEADYIYEN